MLRCGFISQHVYFLVISSVWPDKCPHKQKEMIKSAGTFSLCRPLSWLMHHMLLFNKSGARWAVGGVIRVTPFFVVAVVNVLPIPQVSFSIYTHMDSRSYCVYTMTDIHSNDIILPLVNSCLLCSSFKPSVTLAYPLDPHQTHQPTSFISLLLPTLSQSLSPSSASFSTLPCDMLLCRMNVPFICTHIMF